MALLLPIFLVFVGLVISGKGAPITCPSTEDLRPCTCQRVSYGLEVMCAKFNTSSHLLRAFRILRDYNVNTILLHGLYINEVLPADLFDGMKVSAIRVEKSKLMFSRPAFSGLDPWLHVLNVAQDSFVRSEERFSLAKLTKLNELIVQKIHLDRVEDKWLNEKVPNVHKVDLDFNDIGLLEDHAFANLQSLTFISVAENRIKVIKRSMFPNPALKLTRIDLSYNEISYLPEDFFVGMPSLKEIIFPGNDLKSLHEATWTPVWEQLSQIILSENSIDCDNSIKWIKKYREPRQLAGTCVLPKSLTGHNIKDLYDA
ncbi:hypothetical protein JTE90_017726 [Oedothorax gibbosus]|uniref:Uncharacterized protein n=1 Tax=Oedothorax gibbosus TaxID=931172 RepID=A0AAV6UEF9_9ARAC|nr:hypothetical protein JTE90_017726 [Oedothorax gibbosus]